MSEKLNSKIAVIGIDIGKNSFHIVGQDRRGALVLRQKWSRGQVETPARQTCCRAWSAWRPASVRIMSVASCKCLATTPADAGEVPASLFEGTEE